MIVPVMATGVIGVPWDFNAPIHPGLISMLVLSAGALIASYMFGTRYITKVRRREDGLEDPTESSQREVATPADEVGHHSRNNHSRGGASE